MRKFIIEYEVSTPRKVVLGGFWFMKSFWNVKKYITSIIFLWYKKWHLQVVWGLFKRPKTIPNFQCYYIRHGSNQMWSPQRICQLYCFTLYKRLSQGVKWLFPILFADDIFYKKDMEEMTNELEKVRSWLNCNNLSIDVSKTHHMTIGLRNKCIDDADIRINHVVTQMVFVIKFLSLLIDSKLN